MALALVVVGHAGGRRYDHDAQSIEQTAVREAALCCAGGAYPGATEVSRASRFLAALDACLPPERLQHGRVERMADTIADADGGIGRPYVVEGTLGLLHRRREITGAQLFAGTTFQQWFWTAGLDPLKASGMGQRLGTGTGSYGAFTEHARLRINAALDALGGLSSPCGSACWHVLGLEASIAEWARREGWSGRPLRHETAKLVLIGGLSVLAVHFRIERG